MAVKCIHNISKTNELAQKIGMFLISEKNYKNYLFINIRNT